MWRLRFPVALACCLGLPSAAAAEVLIRTLPDGSHMIYNENSEQRARRQANHLLPVPSSEIADLIDDHARRRGLAPSLVQAVIQVESGYNPKALSNKGAMGLMQLMPATAKDYKVDDPYDPAQNIRAGTAYLSRLLQRYDGDLTVALAAYNAGPTVVDRYAGLPPYAETIAYVTRIITLYRGTPPSLLVDQARDDVRNRRMARAEVERRKPAAADGKKVYITRDANNQIVFTTSPPPSN